MATYNKFQDFVEQLGKGVHRLHAAGDTLMVYLTNTTPDAALDAVRVDLAEITAQNGYPLSGTDIQNGYTETTGTGTMTGVDVVFTASGGAFGPFRYVVLYNNTATALVGPLIGWWDYGSSISCNAGETFTVDFGASVLTIA